METKWNYSNPSSEWKWKDRQRKLSRLKSTMKKTPTPQFNHMKGILKQIPQLEWKTHKLIIPNHPTIDGILVPFYLPQYRMCILLGNRISKGLEDYLKKRRYITLHIDEGILPTLNELTESITQKMNGHP
jgi:hypothetical protein